MAEKFSEERIREIEEQRLKNIKEYGFTIDQVFGYDIKTPHGFGQNPFFDTHTHGLKETYDHPELQIILPLAHDASGYIMNLLVNKTIAKGVRLSDGMILDDVLQDGFKIKIVSLHHQDDTGEVKDRLRVLLPDPNNEFPSIQEQPDSMYAYQLEEIHYELLEESNDSL